MSKETKPQVECVVWIDAKTEDGWSEPDDLDMRPGRITTFGQLVKETPDVLCLAGSRDEGSGQLCSLIFIPTVCIISRRVIEVKNEQV